MTASRITDGIMAIEERVAGVDWRYRGVDLWPLYRLMIFQNLAFDLLGGMNQKPPRPRLTDLTPGVRHLCQAMSHGPQTPRTVLVTNGLTLQKIGDRMLDRFCTPLGIGLDRLGVPNVIFDQSLMPRMTPGPSINPMGDLVFRAKLAGWAAARYDTDSWTRERCALLADAAGAAGLPTSIIPGSRAMAARQNAIFSLADSFQRRLARTGAKQVLQVCYYTVSGLAMNLAARRLGIPVLDVQHGVFDSAPYLRWPRPPENCDSLMPTGYLVWSEDEARLLREEYPAEEVEVIVSGHPMIGAWRGGWFAEAAEARARAAALRQSRPERTHALVTLQAGLTDPRTLAPFIEAVADQADIFWWVRVHPRDLGDSAPISDALEAAGAGFNLLDATHLPLYALLEAVDIHLTHSSSTVIEAAHFGVPSLIWSRYGEELFESQIRSGWARVGMDGGSIRSLLREAGGSADRVPASESTGRLVDALVTLEGRAAPAARRSFR